MARKYHGTLQKRRLPRYPEEREHAQLRKELQEDLRQTRRLEEHSRPRLDLKGLQP